MKMKRNCSALRHSLTCLFLICAFFLAQPQKVLAATNPLSGIPTKRTFYSSVIIGKGDDFITKQLSTNFKLTATSSNKKVATVKVHNFEFLPGKYSKGIEITKKKYGTTKIKLTAVCGKTTFRKTITFTHKKYANPFSTLKINEKNYISKVKTNHTITAGANALRGKLQFKLKKGYKVVRIFALGQNTSTANPYDVVNKTMKNNGTLPSGCSDVTFIIKDKNNVSFNIMLHTL